MSNANDTPGSETGETLEQFRRSFSYGSRSNLNFKFMKSMSDDEAAAFIEDTLRNLSDAYNTGDVAPMIETAISAQIAGYAPDPNGPPPTAGRFVDRAARNIDRGRLCRCFFRE